MRDSIRFVQGGEVREIPACEPTRTVLDHLRCEQGLTGTKEGCAEGDCGACTVVVGELDGDDIHYRAFNACILFLPVLDGKQLITVEDLAGADGELHPVQQAMIDEHGSQCGFCTPGFVMSLFALYHDQPDQAPDRHRIHLGLAGNLCRCTGYAPIERAAVRAMPGGHSDRFSMAAEGTVQLLKSIASNESLMVTSEAGRYHAPRSVDELGRLLADEPNALLVAGATDVGLWVTKQLRQFPVVIHTGQVEELRQMSSEHGELSIGAAVTYSEAMDAVTEAYPAFRPVLERLGGLQVRNAGTIGGNIANGSPIGDTPPALIALGCRLALRSAQGQRVIALEDFYIDYGEQDLEPGEFVEKVLLPLPDPAAGTKQLFSTYKLSKRFEQDISAVCAAFNVTLSEGVVASARVAFGGMAATPSRAAACEAALTGQPWDEDTIAAGMQALESDFVPISDMRASAAYRTRTAANLLRRFYLETTAPEQPVAVQAPL